MADEMQARIAARRAQLKQMIEAGNNDPKVLRELEALGEAPAAEGENAGPSPRELMEHYQRQINVDPDYEEDVNPGSRRMPQLGGPKKGTTGKTVSMARAKDTEANRIRDRYTQQPSVTPRGATPRSMKSRFPSISKQRSTKTEPVPRGTVGRKTEAELDELNRMMLEGLVPSR